MKIVIETIPIESMRYKTCGDYWIDLDGSWQIRVANLSQWEREILVAVHELSEMAQVIHDKISLSSIDAFDIQFEEEREMGLHALSEEPGDSPKAPYRKQHFTSTNIERILSVPLEVPWHDHDKEIMSL